MNHTDTLLTHLGVGALLEETAPSHNYCIALQPICDAELNHAADELLYRQTDDATAAAIAPQQESLATARVCHVAFYETGIRNLVGHRPLFLNTPGPWLLNPELLPPHPDQIVIEVLETVPVNDQILASLARIREMGFRIALDDFVLTAETEPLLAFANIIKVDMLKPWDEKAVAHYRARGLTLLAEKVEDPEIFERLRGQGFTLFQGYFYARAQNQGRRERRRDSNRAALLCLLMELQHPDTDLARIEPIVAQDAHLTFLLLRYVNSAFFRHDSTISTVFQALQMLGLNQVRNMAVILLLANNGPASKLLLARALTRAGMCERLAPEAQLDADAAFLAGLLSMMEPLLGRSLSKLMGELALSPQITEAVLNQKGPMGYLLGAVQAFEQARVRDWSREQVETFNETWLQSQVWATRILSAAT